MKWELITHMHDGSIAILPWYEIKFNSGRIYLEMRPGYCDRGNWFAKLEIRHNREIPATYVDGQDGWPRYYFDLERAKLELEAWINKRGLAL